MRQVQRFLENSENTKNTFEEFQNMLSKNHAVEKQSIEEFSNIQGITGVNRMTAGAFGDINFVVNNVNIQAEMKVATPLLFLCSLLLKVRRSFFYLPPAASIWLYYIRSY